MKASETSDGSLVVTNISWWTLIFSACFARASWALWHRAPRHGGDVFWSLACGAGVFLGLVGLEYSDFRFDVAARRLTWSRRTPYRRDSGSVAFSEITGISMELSRPTTGSGGGGRRIDLHTPNGIIPVTSSFSGFYGKQLRIAQRISALVGCRAPVVT